MRAIVIPRFGTADVLDIRKVPTPRPGPGQVTVDVAFAGVNYAEVLYRQGVVADLPLPFVPGIEIAGHIRSLGEGVTGFQVGQPVAALPIVHGGGYAEVVAIPAQLVVPLDTLGGNIDLATAAASPSNVTTAYLILSTIAHLAAGESVLVHAAAGGVGSALGQMARSLGAGLIIGVVGSPEKVAYAKSLGYDHVLLRSDYIEHVRTFTCGRGIDIVIDQVGGSARTEGLDLLRQFGRLVVMGNASGAEDVALSANTLWFTNKAVLGFNLQALTLDYPDRTAGAVQQALQRVARGEIRVDVTGILPLERATEAHRLIEQRATTGKLVLQI